MDTATAIVIGIIIFSFVCIIGFWFWLERQYTIRLRLREVLQGRKRINDFRVREVTDKDGVDWWRLGKEKNKLRRNITPPPEKAIEIDIKGRKCAEGYRLESGDIIWIEDNGKTDVEIPESIFENVPEGITGIKDPSLMEAKLNKWKDSCVEAWAKENNVILAFQPLTTKQRIIYLDNLKKAKERQGWDWKMQLIPIISIGVLFLFAIAVMVFWGELAQPALQANSQAIQIKELRVQELELIRDIQSDVQRIEQKIDAGASTS